MLCRTLIFYAFKLKLFDLVPNFNCRSLPSEGNQLYSLELHLERCRLLQLRTSLFNTLFSDLIFYSKLILLGGSILGMFFAIRLYQSSLALAAVCMYVSAADIVVFNIIFHRACDIPEFIGKYKGEIRRLGKAQANAAAAAGYSGLFGTFLDSFVRSVKQSGISLGGFYCFQSASTMEYCDFVFNQAMSLLLTYRDPIVVGRVV